ncbi:DUF4347 domain-containing protein [Lusitaniella coriacea LEGE 07157]|uniref:DUF4347 domain-containing protein n=1 Tax=Lusitaniella coriacea LEGE 07157 TaxID=945747 RepID=A0A8J7DWG7_9CYAN|nr:DUF4347 domain-containing protein [Lusitaniella coriacea]MBE9116466.1 DUF4347 domain-containing protein [Lusitaniella coriacea LEGE 07157]
MSNQVLERPRSTPVIHGEGMLVVIDPSVANYKQLVEGVREGADVLILNPVEDGIEQITQYLLARDRLFRSIHIIAHGSPACLYLGYTQLALNNLARYAEQLKTWANSAEPFCEILIYSCRTAAGRGQEFIEQLSQLTGATLAASATLTGSSALGGNWQLERQTGHINSPLAFQPEVMATYNGVFATFDIAAGDVTGLIAAINNANNEAANPGADIINLVAGSIYNLTAALQNFAGNNLGVNRGFSGAPEITSTITINGNGATLQRDGGAPDFRLFYVDGEDGIQGNLTLNAITLSGGRATFGGGNAGNDGGAIFNTGTVTINDSTLSGNAAADDGGAISNFGTLVINRSTLSGNQAGGGGGAIDNSNVFNLGGTTTLDTVTITGNSAATQGGGGIRNQNNGTVTRENSPITGNTPDQINNAATALASNIVVLDGAATIADGSTTPIDFGTITPGGTFAGRTFTISNTGNFNLIIDGITIPAPFTATATPTTIAAGATGNLVIGSTAFQDAGIINGEISIASNDGDNLENPYNFAFSFTVDGPEVNLVDPNNNNVPAGTGTFDFGTVTPGTTFTFNIQNLGTQNLDLSNLILPNGLVLVGDFPATVAPGGTVPLQLQIDPNFTGALNGTIRFNNNDFNESLYQFAITGTVSATVTPPVVPPGTPEQLTNIGDNIFVIGSNGGATHLQFQLTAKDARFINEIGFLRVNANNEILDPQGNSTSVNVNAANFTQTALENSNTVFSVLRDVQPNSLSVRTVAGVTDGTSETVNLFNPGDRVIFYLVSNSTTDSVLAGQTAANQVLFGSTFGSGAFQALQVEDLGDGKFSLAWEDTPGGGDRDFNDAVLTVEQNNITPPWGANIQGSTQKEVLDLRTFGGQRTVRFSVVGSEAAFNNLVGLYRVDTNGQILNPDTGAPTGVAVGAANYQETALNNRVQSVNLDATSQPVEIALDAGADAIYAPFIISDGNTDNVFFPFIGANSDGRDRVRLLADNVLGFEDSVGGFDGDYNDFVLNMTVV